MTTHPPFARTFINKDAVYRVEVVEGRTALQNPITLRISKTTKDWNMLGAFCLTLRPEDASARTMETGYVLQFGDNGPLVRTTLAKEDGQPSLRQSDGVTTVDDALKLYLEEDPTRLVQDFIALEGTRKRKREVTFAMLCSVPCACGELSH